MDHTHVVQLLMQHRTALYAYIFASVRNHSDAEDILQNVSMAVVESFGQLSDESGFLRWSLEIARRRILSHSRQRNREQVLDPELLQQLADAAVRLEHSSPTATYQTALQNCLDSLPLPSRHVIRMRYDGSVTGISELAAQFDRSVQSMYSQIKRIKAVLRECVERRLAAEAQ